MLPCQLYSRQSSNIINTHEDFSDYTLGDNYQNIIPCEKICKHHTRDNNVVVVQWQDHHHHHPRRRYYHDNSYQGYHYDHYVTIGSTIVILFPGKSSTSRIVNRSLSSSPAATNWLS